MPSELLATESPRTPDVAGLLADAPLPHLLVHLARRALTGTLVLRGPAGAGVRLFVREGAPTKIASEPSTSMLGEILVRTGALGGEELDDAVLRARLLREPLGAHLLREGWVERPALLVALRRQILDRLVAAQALPPQSSYEFYADDDFVRDARGEEETACDPLAALLATIRVWREVERMESSLSRLRRTQLALHPSAAPHRFGLHVAERHVVDAIVRECPTLDELGEQGHDPIALRNVIYALAISRHLAIGDATEAPLALDFVRDDGALEHEPSRPSQPPPSFSPTPMPAVRAASTSAVVERVSTPASNELARSLIPPPMARADSTPPPPVSLASASVHFSRAERALANGDVRGARAEAEAAAQADPRVEHRALAVLVRALESPAFEQVLALQALDRLVRESGNAPRLARYRGQLLQRLGRAREARRDFEAALAADPNDVVAARGITALASSTQVRRARR